MFVCFFSHHTALHTWRDTPSINSVVNISMVAAFRAHVLQQGQGRRETRLIVVNSGEKTAVVPRDVNTRCSMDYIRSLLLLVTILFIYLYRMTLFRYHITIQPHSRFVTLFLNIKGFDCTWE